MRKKKLLKTVAISLVLLVSLLLLFVTAFIYNPMEGALPDMRGVVPRNVDFFVRKTDMAEDFAEFPEPAFWADIVETASWRKLARGALVSDLRKSQGLDSTIEELQGLTQQIADSSGGMLDLVDDVLGNEVILAGYLVPPNFARSRYCAYLRVSWKVRFIWGLLGWGSVRESAAQSGLTISLNEDGTFTVVADGQTFYLGRHLDCLLIANDDEILQKSLSLAAGMGEEDSIAETANYRDGIETRLRAWEDLNDGFPVNALEMYARPDQLFNITRWDDNWPNPRHKDDMNERVLASFLNLKSWRFMTGSLLFEEGSLTCLARVELNRNEHSGFQSEFFRAESAPYSDWLKPFLAMVPEGVAGRGACAAAALRMNAADFLVEMYQALDDQSLIDEPLRKTSKYSGARDLIDKLATVLLPRIGFVFMRARDLGEEVVVFDPSPAPHLAWVFWIRPEARQILEEIRDFLTNNRSSLGFTAVTDLKLPGLSEPCREFMNPHIPGTGQIALLLYNDFFVLANSSFVAKDMISARINSQSLLQDDNWEIFERELPSKINGFVYFNGERLANVFTDHVRHVSQMSRDINPTWALANRTRVEKKVFEERWKRYGSIARIPDGEASKFDSEVDAAMDAEWIKHRGSFTAADRQHFEDLKAMCGLLDAGYVQMELDPQFIQLTSAFLMNLR